MIVYFMIWASNVLIINCFILQDFYNHKLNNSAHYKGDETFHENDLEMLNKLEMRRFATKDKNDEFYDLNKLANKAHGKRSKRPTVFFLHPLMNVLTKSQDVVSTTTQKIFTTSKHNIRKRENKKRRKCKTFDYEECLQEYYEELAYDEQQNDTYHPRADQLDVLYYLKNVVSAVNKTRNVNNWTAVKHLIVDFKDRYSKEELVPRLWKLFRIWFLVYLAVAMPLWCTKGWCCCCLCCKFFKPKKTILEAKNYLVQNPPGMQKTRKGHTLYEPTQEERKAYLEFEHLIRII